MTKAIEPNTKINAAPKKAPASPSDNLPANEKQTTTQLDTSLGVPAAAMPQKLSKQALVIALLSSPKGASIAEIMGVTGWLAHTTRAMLTGLKKKGHTLISDKVDDVRRYRINAGTAK